MYGAYMCVCACVFCCYIYWGSAGRSSEILSTILMLSCCDGNRVRWKGRVYNVVQQTGRWPLTWTFHTVLHHDTKLIACRLCYGRNKVCLVVRIIWTPTQHSQSMDHANVCAVVSQDLHVMWEWPCKCTDMCKRVCLQVLVGQWLETPWPVTAQGEILLVV